ncbi:site-specific integrase [Psychrobacillus sp. FSL H8-0510]|uniref:site-specific integrase n=1 Tax=Psychrobacillus sp. FSL H8-0510 TaxID=2921394 RepID=UPI0030F4FD30
MPYGYEKYRLAKGISDKTTVIEVSLIKNFLAYVNGVYKKTVAPHEIRPKDVHNFLDAEREKNISDSTINRKLVYLRNWFNFMWEEGKVPVDFMPKLNYQKKLDLKPKSSIINLNYMELLEKRADVLTSEIPLAAKLFYIFDLRGIRRRDSIRIKLEDIIDYGNYLTVTINTSFEQSVTLELSNDEEIAVLLQAIEKATFRDVEYIFSKKEKDKFVPITVSSENYCNDALAKVLGYPLKSEHVRFSYVHYLYVHENKKIEEIQQCLGTNIGTTTSILKEALVRVKDIDYTNQRRTS